jgi:signal transduction histidine kinase
VVVRTGCEGRLSEVRVIDDGPGMTDEVRRRATEPFFTTHPSVHQGLGLTVARGVAVGHRGSLTLHRAPVHGTEVALRLPQDPPADQRCETAIGAALSAAAEH